jgi:hypothetical protein
VDGSAKRPDGAFHYDLSQAMKDQLEGHLRATLLPRHVRRWIELVVLLRKAAKLPDLDVDVAAVTADDLPAPKPSTVVVGGRVLVVDSRLDYARFQAHGSVVFDPTRVLDDDVTHVAFYADAAIRPEVALLLADYRSLLVQPETANQLQESGRPSDVRAAEIVRQVLLRDDALLDRTVRLLLLSRADDPETVVLPQPVQNDRQFKDRPLAWTVGPRFTRFDALASGPATTSELEARGG